MIAVSIFTMLYFIFSDLTEEKMEFNYHIFSAYLQAELLQHRVLFEAKKFGSQELRIFTDLAAAWRGPKDEWAINYREEK